MRGAELGRGEWQGQIMTRGGGSLLCELPGNQLSMGRIVDSVSSASITVPRGCVDGIAEAREWQHELHLYRTLDDPSLVWAGPLVEPDYTPQRTTFPARDLLQWFERRYLRSEHDFVGTASDLSVIAQALIDDALSLDDSPNISIAATATGVVDDNYYIPADSYLYCMDRLRALARTGLDFTAVGRVLYFGGEEVAAEAIATLSDEHFSSFSVTARGLEYASSIAVTGHGGGQNGWQFFAAAGGVDAERGLVDRVFAEPDLTDDDALQAAADGHLDMLGASPIYISGTLLPEAPVTFAQLIPGARLRIVLEETDRPVDVSARLQSVKADVTPKDGERVSIVAVPLGTTA